MPQDRDAGRCRLDVIDGRRQSLRVGRGERRRGPDAAPHRSASRPRILARLKAGSSPETIIHDLENTDPDLRWRQLAVIAADGKGAVFNGAKITSIVKAKVGRNCSAAGNILRTTDVVDAMVSTFEEYEDQLPARAAGARHRGRPGRRR